MNKYSGKKFLITGGLGFIGSNFIINLIKKHPDCEITNLDAQIMGSNRYNIYPIKNLKNYNFVKGNITNHKLLKKYVKDNDVVINFAAESHVDRSIENPKPFLDSNFMGVYHLLEAIRKYDKEIIQISTDEVFGSLKNDSAHEKFSFNPSSPYASSKASAELLVKSYNKTYGIDTKITRCTNNYGPRQFIEKLIPKIIFLASKNNKIPIYGRGNNLRDWLFVLDHCDAILEIYEKGKNGEEYNISANNEINNNTIVKTILRILNKPSSLIKYVKDRPGHDFRYSLNSNKIRRELGWKPKFNFEDGLNLTIKWYLQNPKWFKFNIKKQ